MIDGRVLICALLPLQEGMLLTSKCIMHRSATETVSIWGWPLQTAGLLRSGFSQRSFTILSGRVTEVKSKASELN